MAEPICVFPGAGLGIRSAAFRRLASDGYRAAGRAWKARRVSDPAWVEPQLDKMKAPPGSPQVEIGRRTLASLVTLSL